MDSWGKWNIVWYSGLLSVQIFAIVFCFINHAVFGEIYNILLSGVWIYKLIRSIKKYAFR